MSILILRYFLVLLQPAIVLAQEFSYRPEAFAGHRTFNYQHSLNYTINEQWSIQNIAVYEPGYEQSVPNSYFLRNTISYSLWKNLSLNGSAGIKNPGTFATIATQLTLRKDRLLMIYSVGLTLQNHYSLEPLILLEYKPWISTQVSGHIRFQTSGNFTPTEFQRGLEQLRVGLTKSKSAYGIAIQADQFNNAQLQLFNFGIYYSYQFT